MKTNIEEIDLQGDSIQWLIKELVSAGMESPLRDAILAAVEETTDEAETTSSEEQTTEDETGEKSRIIKAVQGLTVFVVMFIGLYVFLKWLTRENEI